MNVFQKTGAAWAINATTTNRLNTKYLLDTISLAKTTILKKLNYLPSSLECEEFFICFNTRY